MSPDTATSFRPASLTTTAAQGSADRPGEESARAAGFAAGWAAGARAAADAAGHQQRQLAEQHARAEAARAALVTAAVEALHRAAAALAATTTPVVQEVTAGVHEAALALAEAVLDRELTPGPDSARALLTRIGALPADLGVHTVRMSAADLAHVKDVLAATPALLPSGVTLVADPSLAPGDVVSEHAAGFLDAQVRTALARARRALAGES